MSIKEGGRGFASSEDSVDTVTRKQHKNKRGGRLITVTKNNTDNTRINRTKITRKQKSEEKQMYGYFK